MAEITIPPIRLPEEPYTMAQFECYADRAEDYLNGVKQCISTGGTNQVIQACVNTTHNNYIAGLGICDTL